MSALPATLTAPALVMSAPPLAQNAERFLGWFKFVRRRSDNTLAAYGRDLSSFLAFADRAGLTRPADVTFEHVELYLGAIQHERGVSARTANRHLHALRSWWTWMKRAGLATDNPAAACFVLPTAKRMPEYLSLPEQDRGMAGLAQRHDLHGRRDYALVGTGLLTGLRNGELGRLQVAHLDLEAGALPVVQGKGRTDREVPLVPRLAAILRPYLAETRATLLGGRACPYVFVRTGPWSHTGRANQPLGGKAIFYLVRAALTPLIGRPVHPHMLRHSFATRLRSNGADLQLIQEAMGHASIVTTTMYAHLANPQRLADLARLLA